METALVHPIKILYNNQKGDRVLNAEDRWVIEMALTSLLSPGLHQFIQRRKIHVTSFSR